jgi:CRISPR-associated endonuclease/helicase Cas3
MYGPGTLPSNVLSSLWAKSGEEEGDFHPLLLHLLDVAACAEALLAREPEATRQRMASILGLPWEQARPWLLLLIAAHDLGKATPRFQAKWEKAEAILQAAGLSLPISVDKRFPHGVATQVILSELLLERDWPEDLSDQAADAVGCHHGERAAPNECINLNLDGCRGQSEPWRNVRRQIFEALLAALKPEVYPTKPRMDGPDFMLLAGLTSFADWIGSNEIWFTFGKREDCEDPSAWLATSRQVAEKALDALGWLPREPLLDGPKAFAEVFPHLSPRPLQQIVAQAVREVSGPCVLLVEAPMGEGKTEAAFYAHLELQRRFGHRGLYVALPTKATGNAMFHRTKVFLEGMGCDRPLDLQLLHGATQLNTDFQRLKGIHADHGRIWEGQVRASEWFTHKKRALLSEYGVGTIDQALLPILPVRHQFVRLWGLANRVVVFDEIHAYDAYTGTLLVHLLDWLLALGSSVVLLSATLPPRFRRELARRVGSELPDAEALYPRLTIFQPGSIQQIPIAATPFRRRRIRLEGLGPDLPGIQAALTSRLKAGGLALALLNTVQRAQDLYRLFPKGESILWSDSPVGKRLPDGLEVYLFHARFPADIRQTREDHALALFGPEGQRDGRRLLIATQVAEQSLDLDFDLILTDLAPVDLLLQRAGRLWRHERGFRPMEEPCLLVTGLEGMEPPAFGAPLWWGKVYREDLLLRTWCLLKGREEILLPDEIDNLVHAVYEDEVPVPPSLEERMERAFFTGEGQGSAHKTLANQAVIELSSWDDSGRFCKGDEDEPGRHPSLVAQTRLGEPSVVVVPIYPGEDFNPKTEPEPSQAIQWSLRSLSLSRKGVVQRFVDLGVPEGWSRSPLLRTTFPMNLDKDGRWTEDPTVRLDEELGLCYETKEGA